MAHEEDDDLYDEEFDFVDDEEISEEDDSEEASADDSDDSELADEPVEERAEARRDQDQAPGDAVGDDADVPEDEYGRTEPLANYVVHLYEHQKFTRTIDRPFTPEDAEAFATEFNRTAKNYSRVALTGKNDVKPKKALD
jgi:hypothetical protein